MGTNIKCINSLAHIPLFTESVFVPLSVPLAMKNNKPHYYQPLKRRSRGQVDFSMYQVWFVY